MVQLDKVNFWASTYNDTEKNPRTSCFLFCFPLLPVLFLPSSSSSDISSIDFCLFLVFTKMKMFYRKTEKMLGSKAFDIPGKLCWNNHIPTTVLIAIPTECHFQRKDHSNGMNVGMHLPVPSTASKVSNLYGMNASSKFC